MGVTINFLFNAAVHKCIRSQRRGTPLISLSAVLCYIFVKAGMIFYILALPSCAWRLSLFGEIKEWNFLLKCEKQQQCQIRLFQLDRTVLGFTHSFIESFLHLIEAKPEIPHLLKWNVLTEY